MAGSLPGNTSDTANLLYDPPSYAVGWQEPVYLPNPAAGSSWSRPGDGRYLERLLAVTFTLTTSAVVANRFVTVVLTDVNGKMITEVPGSGAVAASSAVTVCLAAGGPQYASGVSGSSFGFLPDILTPPGYTWAASINGMDAGDTVTNIVLLKQKYPNDTASIPATG